jgi:putative transposase
MLSVKCGGINMPAITNGFRLLQSSYTKGVNQQQQRTGNLFQQKTKAKLVSDVQDYSLTAFFYIHRNPVEAKMVKKVEDWGYSSYQEYTTPKKNGLCNVMRAKDVLGFSEIAFLKGGSGSSDEENVKFIF